MKKYRDIVMRWKNNATFVLLANESQDKIHYAMPQKVMLYDGMDYEEQIRNLWKQRMECQKQARRIGKLNILRQQNIYPDLERTTG